MGNNSDLHSGHRERMRSKFLTVHELSVFTEVEVLEMLLYQSIPRVNTNELAHKLIDRFGSLDGVLSREAEELSATGLVSEKTAFALSFAGSLCAYMQKGSDDAPLTSETIKDYILEALKGLSHETVLLLPLDSEFRVIKKIRLDNGGRDRYVIDKAEILREVLPTGCRDVILAHNHPSGLNKPSGSDIDLTGRLISVLNELGITLIDHFIVGTNGVCSMREGGYFYALEFRV